MWLEIRMPRWESWCLFRFDPPFRNSTFFFIRKILCVNQKITTSSESLTTGWNKFGLKRISNSFGFHEFTCLHAFSIIFVLFSWTFKCKTDANIFNHNYFFSKVICLPLLDVSSLINCLASSISFSFSGCSEPVVVSLAFSAFLLLLSCWIWIAAYLTNWTYLELYFQKLNKKCFEK